MAKKIKPQTLKGFRDFLPEEMVIRQKVNKTLIEVFESYGFQPLETPALEYAETLLGKYGEEADKLIYSFEDKGGRKVGLRYDLTVPVSRVLAQYQGQIPLPFKRYQIQPTWRAEKPQKGRYREFTQCDIDSFGSASPLVDAEIITVIYETIKKLGVKDFKILINTRPMFYSIMKAADVPKEKWNEVAISIDKIDKFSESEVKEEVKKKGIKRGCVEELFRVAEVLKNKFPNFKSLLKDDKTLKVKGSEFNEINEFIKELKGLANLTCLLGVPPEFLVPRFTLARGLDYYTGPIFEAVVEKPKIGSIAGGGRFDQLIADLGGPDIPASGVSFGLDRICEVIKEQKLWPELYSTSTRVLVTVFNLENLQNSIEVAKKLRRAKIATELYLDPKTKIDKQLKYADRKGIPYVIIVGPEEVKKKRVTLKEMATGKQETISLETVVKKISKKTD